MSKTALQASRLNAFSIEPERLVIETDPASPLYDQTERHRISEPFVINIMALGVKEPVIVTKDGERIVVVNGRRRVLHAVEANKRLVAQGEPPIKIPVMLERGDDEHLATVMVTTNELRQDDTVLGKARKAHALISRGTPPTKICIAFGIKQATLTAWLNLMDTCPEVQKAVDQGRLSASAAGQLSGLSRAEQKEQLATLVTTEGTKVTAKEVKRAKAKAKGEDARDLPSRKELRAMLEELDARYGSKGIDEMGVEDYFRYRSTTAMLQWVLDGIRPAWLPNV